jgi:hypothetical protein
MPLVQTRKVPGNGISAFADLFQLSALKLSKIIMLVLIMFVNYHVTHVADLFVFLDGK